MAKKHKKARHAKKLVSGRVRAPMNKVKTPLDRIRTLI